MDFPRTPDLVDVLRLAVERGLVGVRVGMPARVERYDATKQLVDVKPLLQEPLPTTDDGATPPAESLPIVTNVPVIFPGAGGFKVTFPVAVGDVVYLTFADRSLDRWKSRGGEIDPIDPRHHALSDAVAIVGLEDFAHTTGAHATNALFGKQGGGRVEITPDDEVVLNGGTLQVARKTDSVASSAAMTTWAGLVTAALTALTSGAFTATAPATIGNISDGAAKVKA